MRILLSTLLATATLWGSLARANEHEFPLDKLPNAVKDAVEKKFNDARLTRAATMEWNGHRAYGVWLKHDDVTIEVKATAAGEIFETDTHISDEDDKAITAAVKKILEKKYPDAAFKSAVRSESEVTILTVKLQDGDHKIDLVFDEDGNLVSTERHLSATDLPKPVRDAVKKRFPNGEIEDAVEHIEGEVTVCFELSIEDGKKEIEISFDPDGNFLLYTSIDDEGTVRVYQVIHERDLPDAVRAALKREGEFKSAFEVDEDGVIEFYEITVVVDGDERTLLLDPAGKPVEDK